MQFALTEPFSAFTHLGGALALTYLAVDLVRRGRGHGGRVASLIVFAASCVLLLLASSAYHLAAPGAARESLRVFDHAAIFLLIAGSFTPIHAILFRGLWRWGALALVWTLAIVGVILKVLFFARMPEWLGLMLYLGFGWFGLFSGIALARRYGVAFVRPVLFGALAYTLGAVIDFLRWPVPLPGIVGPHELFHVAVLAGIGCHWLFIHNIASGLDPGRAGDAGRAAAPPPHTPAAIEVAAGAGR